MSKIVSQVITTNITGITDTNGSNGSRSTIRLNGTLLANNAFGTMVNDSSRTWVFPITWNTTLGDKKYHKNYFI